MRPTTLILGTFTLLLLIIVPASGAPALLKGSQTNYNLSVSISFNQSCQPIPISTSTPGIVPCPMIPMVSTGLNINGTLVWTITDLNSTTARLNVTRNITTSSGEMSTPVANHAGSFNESINLATRIASIMPFIEPEMDQALQIAQTNMAIAVPTGTSWSSTMLGFNEAMTRQPLHTMWWVNGPLKVNDTVPVLVFPTNVTGSTNLNLGGSIGTRSAWTLAFPTTRSLLPPDPVAPVISFSNPIADDFEFALTFNFDQKSDLLLGATADVHVGFSEETTTQASPCTPSATMVCPASSPISIVRGFGIDVRASLMLTSTSLDLSQRLTPAIGSPASNGSNPGTATPTGPGDNQGSSTGPTTPPNPGPNPSSGGHSPGSGSTPTGAAQPSSNPAQSKPSAESFGLLPWMYGMLGIIAAAIVASGIWIARRRLTKAPSQVAAA